MNKSILTLLTVIFLAGCSSPIVPPSIELGKKCMEKDGTVVYSYVWLHKKGTELSANAETCNLIKEEEEG
ncbi:MAG: hypothetical protein CBB97_02445 [Candidatus Endolissoclinum sp. TMED37]|nr:MAG: hypothetical protein CBB97_02445 [Candidatus Endolissoclinum sp. TMED37]|tara:strand:+ start:156 stop:365 length:210 start_codon:yes stop_codon:yes gene_type:complete